MRAPEHQGRVFVVTAYFWPEEIGCAPHLTDLACALADAGGGVHILTAQPHYPRKTDRARERPPASLSQPTVRIDRIALFDRSSGGVVVRLANDILFALWTAWQRWRTADRAAAALVLAPTVLGVPALRVAGHRGRLVAAVFDIESGLAAATGLTRSRALRSAFARIEAWALNQASAIVALTPAMAESLKALGVRRPITVIPIWPSCPIAASDEFGGENAVPTVMYSGGLGRRHGIECLPPIWHALKALLPSVRLIVQGDGTERDVTFDALRRIGGDVVLRPPVPREALADSLRSADLQLVLQLTEAAAYSVPSKAVACIAAGVPFVTNAAPGTALAAFARDSGGGLVAAYEPASIAASLRDLLTDPPRRRAMQEAARAFARSHLCPERAFQAHREMLFCREADDMRLSEPPRAAVLP